VVPCRFLSGSDTVVRCNVIDWAASKAVPGAGIMLYRHIQGLVGTMINIGGTEDARQVLPRIGFQARAEIHHFARVLRPWRHFRVAGWKDWKSPLRLARDYRELGRPAQDAAHGLTARRVDNFCSPTAGTFPDPSVTQQIICARTSASLNYFLACPATQMEAYLLERQTPAGYFLLSRVGRQCRIADLWIHSADPQEWAEAYAAAAAIARADPHITEVAVAASAPLQIGAIQKAGYRRTHSEPVFVSDPDRRLGGRNDLAVSLLENDGFYWSGNGG
jgi:hypothetical protein